MEPGSRGRISRGFRDELRRFKREDSDFNEADDPRSRIPSKQWPRERKEPHPAEARAAPGEPDMRMPRSWDC